MEYLPLDFFAIFLKKMRGMVVISILLVACTNAFALQGDPPLWGGNCNPDSWISVDSPDFPLTVAVAHKMIRNHAYKMFKTRIAPYIEIDPKTGKEAVRAKYMPQVEVVRAEAEQWERRAKDKVEKYLENDPCPNGLGLVIRRKYLDLVW